IHVVDLAKAHISALKRMEEADASAYDMINIGTGRGYSVLEVIHAFEHATGVKLNYQMGTRRPGDVEKIYGEVNKARQVLNWETELSIESMMSSAWAWEKYIKDNPF